MKVLTDEYLSEFVKKNVKKIQRNIKELYIDADENNFEYYLDSSAVFSSNIEGNSIDLNSYMNSKMLNKKNTGKEYKEIKDLTKAYSFAKEHTLNQKNFLVAHRIFSKQFLIKSKQGKLREEKIGVFDSSGLIYVALEPEFVTPEIKKLFDDIEYLNKCDLRVEEVFYYASLIHLKLAHIHPFMDGNGRAARLAEKWFLSLKTGVIAWKIRSEKYYFENRSKYYENINLGQNYYELNYRKSFPFLEMLSNSIK